VRSITPKITAIGNAWDTVTMPALQIRPGQRIKRIQLTATNLTNTPSGLTGMERRCVGDLYLTVGPVGQTTRLNLTELRLFGIYEGVFWEGDYIVDSQEVTIGADFVCPSNYDCVVLVVDYE